MAIASNIFKQLLYVAEGTTIGIIDADTSTTLPTIGTTDANAYKLGDDEVTFGYTAGAGTSIPRGTKLLFGSFNQAYYTTTDVATTSGTTAVLKLDRPLVNALTASTSITASYTSPNKQNQPKLLRRVSSNLDAKFETYSSNEIRGDQQLVDARIGAKTVDGTIAGELSSYTYTDFFASLLRKDFYSPVKQNATSATIGLTLGSNTIIGVNNANTAILTFGAGDVGSSVSGADGGTLSTHLFSGLRVGDVITIEPSGVTAATIAVEGGSASTAVATWAAVPFMIVDKDTTSRTLTIVAANNPSTVTFAAGTLPIGTKYQVMGQKSFIPLTGHKRKSFQFEHFYSDLSETSALPVSDLFTGCRVTQGAVKLPVSGIATVDFSVMGIGTLTSSDTIAKWDGGGNANFAAASTKSMMETLSGDTPKSSGVDSIYTSSVGNIYYKVAGQLYKADAITGFDFTINGNGQTLKVIGSTTSPDVVLSKIQVSGNMSVYFKDNTLRNAFVNSNEISMIAFFSESLTNSTASSFMNFAFPRIKLTGATKDDSESITMSMPFQALLSDGNNQFEATTIQIQDYAETA